jgi:hypothetical protein
VFFRRGVAEDDAWLQAKLWLFTVGALLALAGMLLENQWLIGAAALVLAIGIVLRFIPRTDGERDEVDSTDGPTP